MKSKYWIIGIATLFAAIILTHFLWPSSDSLLKGILAEKEKEILEYKTNLATVDKKIKDKDAQIKSKDAQIKAKDTQIANLRKEKAKKEAEVIKIEDARKKITVPDDIAGIVSEFRNIGYKSCTAFLKPK